MIAYYIRQAFSYIPVAMLWIAFLYLMALYKQPAIVAGFFSEDGPWLRKFACTIIFLVFSIPFFGGFAILLKDTPPTEDWHEFFNYFFVGVPLLFGAGLTGAYMVGVGLVATAEVERKLKEAQEQERRRDLELRLEQRRRADPNDDGN